MSVTEKFCPACRRTLPADAFTRAPSRRDGLTSKCKPCYRAYIREWRRAKSSPAVQREAASRQAYSRALGRLRDLHRDEFEALLEQERSEVAA